MRWIIRIVLLSLQVVILFVLLVLGSQAWSHLTAETYDHGATPSGLFPLVATRQAEPATGKTEYQVVRWRDISQSKSSALPLTFTLPEPQARFRLERVGGFEPVVIFKATARPGGRQLIEVKLSDDDYQFFSRYATDGTTVWPEYLRIYGISSTMMVFFPALILTWLLGRVVAWLWKRRSSAKSPITG
jgi:hypothetical protein